MLPRFGVPTYDLYYSPVRLFKLCECIVEISLIGFEYLAATVTLKRDAAMDAMDGHFSNSLMISDAFNSSSLNGSGSSNGGRPSHSRTHMMVRPISV